MLDPWYVTGLSEGEGCFSVSFNLRERLKVKIETKPSFSISLDKGDLSLLKSIREYFDCGGIRFSRSDRVYKYEVRSLPELLERIIPHFEKYPLQGRKIKDFELFREICFMMKANLHLSAKYLRKIIDLAYEMNPSGKRRYTKEDLLRVLGRVKG